MPSPETTQNIRTPKPPEGQSLQQAADAPPNVEALSTSSTTLHQMAMVGGYI